jgi:hypothetical protein
MIGTADTGSQLTNQRWALLLQAQPVAATPRCHIAASEMAE